MSKFAFCLMIFCFSLVPFFDAHPTEHEDAIALGRDTEDVSVQRMGGSRQYWQNFWNNMFECENCGETTPAPRFKGSRLTPRPPIPPLRERTKNVQDTGRYHHLKEDSKQQSEEDLADEADEGDDESQEEESDENEEEESDESEEEESDESQEEEDYDRPYPAAPKIPKFSF